MSMWIIEPRDAIIFRDGRPFAADPGARAKSLAFPFPSSITGGLRTRAGLDAQGIFRATVEESKKIAVRGPLLVEIAETGEIAEWFAPAPADALLFDGRESNLAEVHQLVPLETPEGAHIDLANDLHPVGLVISVKAKPSGKAPRFWRWEKFERWLKDPQTQQNQSISELGVTGPLTERRTHVRIDPLSFASLEGNLFQTSGLEFTASDESNKLSTVRRLALAVETSTTNLKPGMAPLGGERRLVMWRESRQKLHEQPKEIVEKISRDQACRVVLLTPACFKNGWKPEFLLQSRDGVTVTLKAASVGRPLVVSGWDFALSEAKKTRRLAPAGSVYFAKLTGESNAVKAWAEHQWMQSIRDEEQDRRDGFGLAVLGTWNGQPETMEAK